MESFANGSGSEESFGVSCDWVGVLRIRGSVAGNQWDSLLIERKGL
jgi:hypothetical protein